MIGIIAAVTTNGVIGVQNQLPFNYSEDLLHFRKTTTDSVVIMGKNTFESIGKPLPKRRNIVVTRSNIDGVETVTSLKMALELASNDTRHTWLIGGASIYEEGMMFADKIVLTITPDIEKRSPAVKFPWINPNIFKLLSINNLNENSPLLIATYQK